MRPVILSFGLSLLILSAPILGAEVLSAEHRLPVKVVVAAMFERGEATGDEPGELQFWVERLQLDNALEFPLGQHDIYLNDEGVMLVLLGGGVTNSTASVMALGLDPRFDLTKAYWLVAGIAGGDPADISLGSAAWASHVVDGDLLYEIDGREIPDDWPYGMVPLGAKKPALHQDEIENGWVVDTISFSLNKQLVDWAYSITKDIQLEDADGIAAYREMFVGLPEAQRAPFVTKGDTLSSSTYWHGNLLNEWANDWVRLYAGSDANFMTSNMEDSGTLTALHRLERSGYVDTERVMILRTVSNFTTPPPGKSAQWSRSVPYPDNGHPSLEAAFVVGNTVVQALLEKWNMYENHLPKAKEQNSQ
jgi:purine nucleoside permease